MTCPFCNEKVVIAGLPITTTGSWDAKLRCLPANTYAGGVPAGKREHLVEVEVRYG